MKKLASWYRKWDKELETQFTFALLVLNFMTNVLILCGLYLFLYCQIFCFSFLKWDFSNRFWPYLPIVSNCFRMLLSRRFLFLIFSS